MATARTAASQLGAARFTEAGLGGILESAVCAAHTISSLLHAFKKTTQNTEKRDIDLAKYRLKSLVRQDISPLLQMMKGGCPNRWTAF
ncbi:hypothetical protein D3C84_408020 [compost metagenome]|uniref:type II toxin-antitoxin system RelE/ParE family toxin n=1 Tax=Pseudomonas sp. ACN8 TaxID=1920428 RepID=UPI000FB471BC